MKKNIMILATTILASFGATAQKDPAVTEIYEPVPSHVIPGKDNSAPSDAIVLFSNGNLNEWESIKDNRPAEWTVSGGELTVKPGTGDIITKKSFGDCQLHIEWRCPAEAKGEGQGRSNSGVLLQSLYEIQVLDSYENKTYTNGQAGSVYKQYVPLANASSKPGEWNVYDIVFTAPRFGESGRIISPAYVTVFHNGILIQNHVPLWGGTEYIGLPVYRQHDKLPLRLQDHGDMISFRNIWIREL